MTLTIELTPEQEVRLVAAATHNGLAPTEFLQQLVVDHLPQTATLTLAEILAPIHDYSRQQKLTDQEIGEFADSEVAAFRAERRARQITKP